MGKENKKGRCGEQKLPNNKEGAPSKTESDKSEKDAKAITAPTAYPRFIVTLVGEKLGSLRQCHS